MPPKSRRSAAETAEEEASLKGLGLAAEQLQQEKGLTLDAVARRGGLSSNTVSDLKKGLREKPPWGTMRRLANGLGISLNELVELGLELAPGPAGDRLRQREHEVQRTRANAQKERLGMKRRKVKKRGRRKEVSRQEALIKALAHPLRAEALNILSQRTASPKEMAEELNQHLSNVSYHVRVLDELGLIEPREEQRVKGAIETFYSAVQKSPIENADWKDLSPTVRAALSAQLLEALISDVSASLANGSFDRRRDRHLSRTPLILDEKGWDKVIAIQERALRQVLAEQKAAGSRLKGVKGKVIHAVAGMLCIEMPHSPRADK